MRRKTLDVSSWTGAVALGAALLTAQAAAATAAETVKVGVILTYSGPMAQLGDQIQKGIDLYVKEHGKELPSGVTLALVKRDDTGPNPEVAKRLAQELITREHVALLTGVVWTPNAAAIAPLTVEAKVPFIIMNAATASLTRLSPYIARVSFTQWQFGVSMGQWAAKHGMKRAYTAVSDYAPGYDAEASFIRGYKDAGGDLAGSVRFPLKDPDFVPFLQRIKDAKPNVVYLFIPGGAQATAVMKAYNDLNMKQAGISLMGPQDVVDDDELPNMGDAPLGLVTVGNYSSAATRPQNQAFVAAWHRAYGAASVPDFMSVGGWDGMAAIFSVIKAGGGTVKADDAMKVLANWKNPDSPRGPIMIDPATRDIIQNVYIRRTEKLEGKLANIEFDTIPQVKDPWKEENPPK